jgi:UDP-N-acetyl-D-glucosamine dehydrogenase
MAARSITATLRPGQLVVLESTTYPGTTRDVVLPILAESGLSCGTDFFLAYSPEREDPGNRRYSTTSIPRVVGGIDEPSGRLATQLYASVIERVISVRSAEIAEASKILENTYRAVNIALVNELKVLYDRMGIDIWEVIDAASTKPFGFQPFYPGPGLGGHCIPIDPFYLAWIARRMDCPARLVELAGEINRAMPAYVIEKLTRALTERGRSLEGSRIGLLGLAYKKDVADVRESPGVELLVELTNRGALVTYSDPHVPHLPADERHPALASQLLTEAWLGGQDAVVIVTDHSAYEWDLVARAARLIVDTRNALPGARGIVVRA